MKTRFVSHPDKNAIIIRYVYPARLLPSHLKRRQWLHITDSRQSCARDSKRTDILQLPGSYLVLVNKQNMRPTRYQVCQTKKSIRADKGKQKAGKRSHVACGLLILHQPALAIGEPGNYQVCWISYRKSRYLSKYQNIDVSYYRNVSCPPIPWHPCVLKQASI